MKLAVENREVEATGFNQNATQFRINGNAMAFKILSDGLYSDKPLAVIRELGCNAYDAHVDAGTQDKPFDVHLPNSFEPFFSIRDYGIGLSDEDLENMYATYFESTKQNSNNHVGAFGLGSKSPFSYVDQFSVSSYFNGTVSHYTAYMGQDGTPCIQKINSEPTDEHNGLFIQMMVKSEDFNKFAEKAQEFFHRLPTLPRITGNTVDLTCVSYILEGKNFRFRDKTKSPVSNYGYGYDRAYVIQGHVAYPIEVDKLEDLTTDQRSIVRNVPIDIMVDIGDVSVTPSREHLQYDKHTVTNLTKKIIAIHKELKDYAQEQLTNATTLWEAKRLFGASRLASASDTVLGTIMSTLGDTKIKWKNDLITNSKINIKMYESVTAKIGMDEKVSFGKCHRYSSYELRQEYTKATLTRHKNIEHLSVGVIPCMDERDVYIWADDASLVRKINSIIHHNFSNRSQKGDVYVFEIKDSKMPQFLEQFEGFDNWVKLSDLELPPKKLKTISPVKKIAKAYKVTSFNSYGINESSSPSDVDIADGGYYAVTYNNEYISIGNEFFSKGDDTHKLVEHSREMNRIGEICGSFGLIDLDKEPMYVFNSSFRHLIEGQPNWVPYYKPAVDLMKDIISDKEAIKYLKLVVKLNKFIGPNLHKKVFGALMFFEDKRDLLPKSSPFGKSIDNLVSLVNTIINTESDLVASIINNITVRNSINTYRTEDCYTDRLKLLLKHLHVFNSIKSLYKYLVEMKVIKSTKQLESIFSYNSVTESDLHEYYPHLDSLISCHNLPVEDNIKNTSSYGTETGAKETDLQSIMLYISMCDKNKKLVKQVQNSINQFKKGNKND